MSEDIAQLRARISAQEYVVVRLLAEIARRSPDGWDIVADIIVGAEQQFLNLERQGGATPGSTKIESRYFRTLGIKLNEALGRPVEERCHHKKRETVRA